MPLKQHIHFKELFKAIEVVISVYEVHLNAPRSPCFCSVGMVFLYLPTWRMAS